MRLEHLALCVLLMWALATPAAAGEPAPKPAPPAKPAPAKAPKPDKAPEKDDKKTAEPDEDDEDDEDFDDEDDDDAIGPDDDDDDDDDDGYRLKKDVTIEAKREKLLRKGGSVSAVGADELNRTEPDDAADALGGVPSVQIRGEDGYGLRPNIGIRGTSSERSKKITLMEDGVLFGPAPYAAPAAYYFPLMTRMVGIDVFKGPAAIQFGPHTVGGAIDLISRPVPYKLELGADLAFGTDLYFKANAHGGTTFFFDGAAGFGFLIEGTHLQTDGFKEVDGDPDAGTGFSRSEVTAKARLHSDLDGDSVHTLDAKFTWSREHSDETYLGLTDADLRADTYRRYAASHRDEMDWMRFSGQVDYTFETGNLESMPQKAKEGGGDDAKKKGEDKLFWGFKLKSTFYRHDFERDWLKVSGFRGDADISKVLENPTSGSNAVFYSILTGASDSTTPDEDIFLTNNGRTFRSMGGQLLLSTTLVHGAEQEFRHEIEFGARYHGDAVIRDHDGFYYRMQQRRLQSVDSDVVAVLDNEGKASAFSTFLQYGFRWRGLSLNAGLRLENIATSLFDARTGETAFNKNAEVLGGAGAHWEIYEGLGVLFGVHQGFSPVAPGQPDGVAPETSLNWEAGVRYGNPKTGTLAEAIFFYNDYANLSGQCSFSSGCDPDQLDSQFNAGEVDVMGLELVAQHAFVAGPVEIPVKLAYTFTHTEFQSDFTSVNPQFGKVRAGDELPYVPAHRVQLSVGAAMKRWDLSVALNLVSPMREAAGSDPDAPMTDFQIGFAAYGRVQILKWLQVYTKFENLFVREDIISRRPYGARPNRPLSAQLGVKLEY